MKNIYTLIVSILLPLTCFGASGNCEWLPYSTMGTAAGGATASSGGGFLYSTALSSSTSGGLFCDWVNIEHKQKVQFIVYNNENLIEDISKGEGDHLNALSVLYNCSLDVNKYFNEMVRESFMDNGNIYFDSKINYQKTQILINEIQNNINKNILLKEDCKSVGWLLINQTNSFYFNLK